MKTQEEDKSVAGFMSPAEAFFPGIKFNSLLMAFVVISLFLPWFRDLRELWGLAPIFSGPELGPALAKIDFWGKILVITASFFQARKVRGSVFLGVGALALVFFLIVYLQKQGSSNVNQVLEFGMLLYGLVAMGLIFGGLGELLEKK